MPMVFRYENIGVCPKIMLTDFSFYVMKAHSWWDKGQLGVNFLEAPAWVNEAFSALTSERNKALRFISNQKRAQKK